MTERLLNFDVLSNVFQDDGRIGSFNDYANSVRELHHQFLKSELVENGSVSMDIDRLLDFAEDAQFLATQYTNPLVVNLHDDLPIEDVPSRQIVQDALALAGTIFEYVADIVSLMEKGDNYEHDILDPSERYYLKSGICYGLGLYESRTQVILARVLGKITRPSEQINISNHAEHASYVLCSLLSRRLNSILMYEKDNNQALESMNSNLRNIVMKDTAHLRLSRFEILQSNYSISIIWACIYAAHALLNGNNELFQNYSSYMEQAINSVYEIGNFDQAWLTRTVDKLIFTMWETSPWVQLENVIHEKAYLKQLVDDGYATLWSSQIQALKMQRSERFSDLNGGYLDDRLKRIIVNMPTSAGKTLLAELALASQLFKHPHSKCIYVAPYRALRDQIANKLSNRLGQFGFRVTSIVSDNDLSEYEDILFSKANVLVLTPEKLNFLVRQNSVVVSETEVFIFDEIHNIGNSGRGWKYEELISLLIQDSQTKAKKMLFISAIMPNHLAIREWLDPDKIGDSISTLWQPTRLLKGAIRFATTTVRSPQNIDLPGKLIYVRHRDDLDSPLEIDNIISSHQVIVEKIPKSKNKNDKIPYLQVDFELSDGVIEHAVKATTKFAKLGPVLIYTPTKDGANKFALQAKELDLKFLHWRTEQDKNSYFEVISFIEDRLPSDHPLIDALRKRVAFHHAGLPSDVRSEIEYAFERGWIHILAATSTLIEGVNLPVKTLLISDYYTSRYWVPKDKKLVKRNQLEDSSFQNMAGRAGRALFETEGQVIFIQPIISGFPYDVETDFEKYLDLDHDSRSLEINSTLVQDELVEKLSQLVQEIDTAQISDAQFLYDLHSRIENDQISNIVEQLQTFTLLLEQRLLDANAEEDFVHIFQRTLANKQQPNRISNIVGAFSHRSLNSAKNLLDENSRSLYSQTGLKLRSCQLLYTRTNEFWQRNLSEEFLMQTELNDKVLMEIALVIYDFADVELDPPKVLKAREGEGSRTRVPINHETLFVDWLTNPGHESEIVSKYFSDILDKSWRAEQFIQYVHDVLEYKLPWILSAFWIFSKSIVTAHGRNLSQEPLGKELLLLPAYTKFGVNTPAAAFFSTLGISPSKLSLSLSDLFYSQQVISQRYAYVEMLEWIFRLEPFEIAQETDVPSLYISRFMRLRDSLKPISTDSSPVYNVWQLSFNIAGWQYYEGDGIISYLGRGTRLQLVHEPENEHDKRGYAVAIYTQNEQKLGYVPWNVSPTVVKKLLQSDIIASVLRVNKNATPYNRVHVVCREN